MAKLIYAAIASLDGYVVDASGSFEWAAPDEEVHAFVNDLVRPIGTHLYGRRMYEVLSVWETLPTEGEPAVIQDFAAIWRAADKIVYSHTLQEATTPHTRIERTFDPEAVRSLKADSTSDLTIGGPTLAAEALHAGLVDELHLIAVPVVVGGGTNWLPRDLRLELELLDERRFANGTVYVHYRTKA